MVSRLLGISKDSVLTVDYVTKEVLQRWPLDHLRRWAPTPNGFTLDLGEYADEWYSVLTDESAKIAELLAGYIDLLLKKRRIVEQTVPDGTAQSTCPICALSLSLILFFQFDVLLDDAHWCDACRGRGGQRDD